jgi:hypothetical protein
MGDSGPTRIAAMVTRGLRRGLVDVVAYPSPPIPLLAQPAWLPRAHAIEPFQDARLCRTHGAVGVTARRAIGTEMTISATPLRHAAPVRSCAIASAVYWPGCNRLLALHIASQTRAKPCMSLPLGVGMRTRTPKFSDTETRKPASETQNSCRKMVAPRPNRVLGSNRSERCWVHELDG